MAAHARRSLQFAVTEAAACAFGCGLCRFPSSTYFPLFFITSSLFSRGGCGTLTHLSSLSVPVSVCDRSSLCFRPGFCRVSLCARLPRGSASSDCSGTPPPPPCPPLPSRCVRACHLVFVSLPLSVYVMLRRPLENLCVLCSCLFSAPCAHTPRRLPLQARSDRLVFLSPLALADSSQSRLPVPGLRIT